MLGEGPMGEVYRAQDTALNCEVAINVQPPAFAVDPSRLVRFKREVPDVDKAANRPIRTGFCRSFPSDPPLHLGSFGFRYRRREILICQGQQRGELVVDSLRLFVLAQLPVGLGPPRLDPDPR